jgi:hypothetical protein
MSATRTEITQSIDATRAALSRLSPLQVETVIETIDREMREWIATEWLLKRKDPLDRHEDFRRRAGL